MIMDRDRRRRRSAAEHNRDYRPGREPYPDPVDGEQNRGQREHDRRRDDHGRTDG